MQVPGAGGLFQRVAFSLYGTPSIVSGGTGYSTGSTIGLDGGSIVPVLGTWTGTGALLTVDSVDTAGAITSVSVVGTGAYTGQPSGTATGGGGEGATFDPVWKGSNWYPYTGPYVLTISASQEGTYFVQLAFWLAFGFWPTGAENIRVIINSGVYVVNAGDPDQASITFAAVVPPWTQTTGTITIENHGSILGAGGAGGSGGGTTSGYLILPTANDGGTGGTALELDGKTVTIINADGYIWGGGGGGGAGGSAFGAGSPTEFAGGAGGAYGPWGTIHGEIDIYQVAGKTKSTGDGFLHACILNDDGTLYYALNDTYTRGGVTETITYLPTSTYAPLLDSPNGAAITGTYALTGGTAGAAGDYGAAGSAGSAATGDNISSQNTPGNGGAAGKAINLTGGTANFTSGGTSPNVKGAVS